MGNTANPKLKSRSALRAFLGRWYGGTPLLGWLLGALLVVLLEQVFGESLAEALGLRKVPALFGVKQVFNKKFFSAELFSDPEIVQAALGALAFVVVIYLVPMSLFCRFGAGVCNALARRLERTPLLVSALVHLGLLYTTLHLWVAPSGYRYITLRLMLVAIMVTMSLNVINGYMGEFCCSHPGFMALGAYGASVFTVGLFVNDKLFGAALLPEALGPWLFPVALIFGGLMASLGALVVAIPSFRTRGDYLAIISLAFMFMVKSGIENLEFLGGPRGMLKQPDWATLPVVFIAFVLCLWTINNFVRSTLGKALNAVRDDEGAADAMTVNTRKTKMTAFLFSAFWAGVAGGLIAHVIRHAHPGSYGLQRLADVLAMVYFGGLNSLVGSMVGAVSISMLNEALSAIEIARWIVIPLLLILVMIFRPTGLIAFREFDVRKALGPRNRTQGEN